MWRIYWLCFNKKTVFPDTDIPINIRQFWVCLIFTIVITTLPRGQLYHTIVSNMDVLFRVWTITIVDWLVKLAVYMRALLPEAGPWFNIKITSYQYRKSHFGDKTVVRSSYLHNGTSYIGKMSSLYWIGAQVSQAWISNCIPQDTMGCNYISLLEIPASGNKVLIWLHCNHNVSYIHLKCISWASIP